MGTASPRTALFYYCFLAFLKTAAQGLTNMSMTQINYPAKTLFKSANPIITMLIGLVWFRRTYMIRDYVVVALLVLGLYIFMRGDSTTSPNGSHTGIILVTIAMFGSAAVPVLQEYCINKYNATVEELLYHSFLGSTVISLVLSIYSGELVEGTNFLIAHGDFWTWVALTAFCTVGFCGSNFSTGLTLRFGSLVNGITNTARKAVTLVLSFVLFPERNKLTGMHVVGAVIFFIGLVVRTVIKDKVKVRNKDSFKKVHFGDDLQTTQSLA